MLQVGDDAGLVGRDGLREHHQQLFDVILVGERDLADADEIGQQDRQGGLQPLDQLRVPRAAAGPPLTMTPATASSWVCSSAVTVARCDAHARIASEVLVCESSTGWT